MLWIISNCFHFRLNIDSKVKTFGILLDIHNEIGKKESIHENGEKKKSFKFYKHQANGFAWQKFRQ